MERSASVMSPKARHERSSHPSRPKPGLDLRGSGGSRPKGRSRNARLSTGYGASNASTRRALRPRRKAATVVTDPIRCFAPPPRRGSREPGEAGPPLPPPRPNPPCVYAAALMTEPAAAFARRHLLGIEGLSRPEIGVAATVLADEAVKCFARDREEKDHSARAARRSTCSSRPPPARNPRSSSPASDWEQT